MIDKVADAGPSMHEVRVETGTKVGCWNAHEKNIWLVNRDSEGFKRAHPYGRGTDHPGSS